MQPFKNEDELYGAVLRAFEQVRVSLEKWPGINLAIESELSYSEKPRGSRTLYLLGESHGSRKPIDHIHEKIVPKIKKNPKNWLLLREGYGFTEYMDVFPPALYFQGIAKLFNIPYEIALADLLSLDTREYIRKREEISDEDIDREVLAYFLETEIFIEKGLIEIPRSAKDLPKEVNVPWVVHSTSEHLKKPWEYVWELLKTMHQHPDRSEEVLRSWNEFSKERFNKLIELYPDRNDILVSVGDGHLPVFE
jgi:hypothetical protein